MTTLSPTIGEFVERYPNPVRALRELPSGDPRANSRLHPEFTNWLVEQASTRTDVALLDQSEHMSDIFVSGPDAFELLSRLTLNSFKNFKPGQAKQFIAPNPEGYLISDGILVYLDEGRFDVIADPILGSWIRFNAERSGLDVQVEISETNHWFTSLRSEDPTFYRYEIQGPKALEVIEQASGAPIPPTKFFHLAEFTIAGHRVRGIRHGMSGQPGFEFFGPYAEGEDVRRALLEAGEQHGGVTQIGYTAYFTNNIESGWFVVSLPAIYSAGSMKEFRDQLPIGAVGPIGGSFDSEDVEDYYVTPFDLGYDAFIDWDKDFVGRDALARMRDDANRRDKSKVTLIWNEDDLADLHRGLFTHSDELPPQKRDLHDLSYTVTPFDALYDGDTLVGYAIQSAYIAADRVFASLAAVDPEYAAPGTELTLLWGDSLAIPRPEVEPHRQVRVRVTVAPIPFSEFARTEYRK